MNKKSGGQVKPFTIAENESLWQRYYLHKLKEANNSTKPRKTKPETNLAQYKPGLKTLEQMTSKPFADITATDLQAYDLQLSGKNMAYIKAFFITILSQGWISLNSPQMALYLIPNEYSGLISKVIEQNTIIQNVAV